jgi:hypothetical protein
MKKGQKYPSNKIGKRSILQLVSTPEVNKSLEILKERTKCSTTQIIEICIEKYLELEEDGA